MVSIYLVCIACAALPPSSSNEPAVRLSNKPKLPGYVVKRKVKARRVLVLVHGLNGDGTSTWTAPNGTYWPALMENDPAFQDFDIYVYEYSTGLFGSCLAISDLVNNMRLHLKNADVFEDHEQVVFLAHSMGGLIVRQYLLRNRDAVEKVPLSMFFATPTGGSRQANIAHLFTTCNQVDDLRILDVNSYLKSQQSDWLSSGLQEKVISYCAFETQSSGGSLTVDRSSATLLCKKDPEALQTNHSDAVKPKGPDDLQHIIVRNALKDLPLANLTHLDQAGEISELKKKNEDLTDRLNQRFRNRAIREQLGRFLTEGNNLLPVIFKGPPVLLPEKEANDWYSRTIKYLHENLDSSFEARFVSPDPSLPISYGLPKEYENLITGIQTRLAVIRHILEELRE